MDDLIFQTSPNIDKNGSNAMTFIYLLIIIVVVVVVTVVILMFYQLGFH